MTYEITDQAVRQARHCGLRADDFETLRSRLAVMLGASVKDETLSGDRSYGPYSFRISGRRLMWVERRGPRAADPETTGECAICGGTMTLQVEETIGGTRATVVRPCPRVANPSRQRCDLSHSG